MGYLNSLNKLLMVSTLFIIVLISNGCEKELFYDLEKKGGTITLFSFIQPDSVLKISISKSVSIVDARSYSFVEDTRFIIYENNVLYRNQVYPDNSLVSAWPATNFTAHDTIKILLLQNNEEVASATTIIPEKVEINHIDSIRTSRAGSNGSPQEVMRLTLSFTDIPLENNYYQLMIIAESDSVDGINYVKNREIISFDKNDKIFNNPDQGTSSIGTIDFQGLFTDYEVDGDNIDIHVELPVDYFNESEVLENQHIIVLLYHLSKDYYLYMHSRIIADSYDGVPIFDPVKIHTNVSGGHGVFGSLTHDADTIYVGSP